MKTKLCLAVTLVVSLAAGTALSQTAVERKRGPVTNLPLPRFVSLKADEVNARVGPGTEYAIGFVFRRAGLTVELLNEFDTWRQVRDSAGSSGWVAAALISGRRTAVVAPWKKNAPLVPLTSSRGGSSAVAQMEIGAVVDIGDCDGEFCKVYAGKAEGYVSQANLWGVYPGEQIR
jgi:SH3-like domain-containing protein